MPVGCAINAVRLENQAEAMPTANNLRRMVWRANRTGLCGPIFVAMDCVCPGFARGHGTATMGVYLAVSWLQVAFCSVVEDSAKSNVRICDEADGDLR